MKGRKEKEKVAPPFVAYLSMFACLCGGKEGKRASEWGREGKRGVCSEKSKTRNQKPSERAKTETETET